MVAIHVSKQKALDADPIVIHQINLTGNLARGRNTKMFFIIEKAKEIVVINVKTFFTRDRESSVILF